MHLLRKFIKLITIDKVILCLCFKCGSKNLKYQCFGLLFIWLCWKLNNNKQIYLYIHIFENHQSNNSFPSHSLTIVSHSILCGIFYFIVAWEQEVKERNFILSFYGNSSSICVFFFLSYSFYNFSYECDFGIILYFFIFASDTVDC